MCFRQLGFEPVGSEAVKSTLAMTGSCELLDQLSGHIPDQFINQQWPLGPTGGRRRSFSAAQLWRVHLLLLLTPARSVNLLVRLLGEHRAWRGFAHLSHRERVPDVRMLFEFRHYVGVGGLRRINNRLLTALVSPIRERRDSIAIIDATDLPARCRGFKKRIVGATAHAVPRWAAAQLRVAKAIGMSVTGNTRSGFGWCTMNRQCCWSH